MEPTVSSELRQLDFRRRGITQKGTNCMIKHDRTWTSWAVVEVSEPKGGIKTNSVFHEKLTLLLLGDLKSIQKAGRSNSEYVIRFYARNKPDSH